jgi:photoactive yellow protein
MIRVLTSPRDSHATNRTSLLPSRSFAKWYPILDGKRGNFRTRDMRWCEAALKRGNLQSPLSHGICLSCMAAASGDPVEDLSDIEPVLFDALPFGAIQLAGDGTVIAYNRGESALSGLAPEAVLGRNFFREVAPCTSVKEFGGQFEAMRAKGEDGRAKLRFLFTFAHGAKLVEIVMVYRAATDTSTLLVKLELSEPSL